MGRVSRGVNPNLNDVDSTDTMTPTGTETNNAANSPVPSPVFNPDIYSYINACFENLKDSHIASLKTNISSYKKECKELQEKYENLLAQTNELKGSLSKVEKYCICGLIAIGVQFIAACWVHFGYILPKLTEIELLKQKVEGISQPILHDKIKVEETEIEQ